MNQHTSNAQHELNTNPQAKYLATLDWCLAIGCTQEEAEQEALKDAEAVEVQNCLRGMN